MPLLDVWAEYHRLARVEGWTQARIATVKGCDQPSTARRVAYHEMCTHNRSLRKAVCDGTLEEGHLQALESVLCDVTYLQPWLTTTQAQSELVGEVLEKHRGSSKGIKPTVG